MPQAGLRAAARLVVGKRLPLASTVAMAATWQGRVGETATVSSGMGALLTVLEQITSSAA